MKKVQLSCEQKMIPVLEMKKQILLMSRRCRLFQFTGHATCSIPMIPITTEFLLKCAGPPYRAPLVGNRVLGRSSKGRLLWSVSNRERNGRRIY